MIYWEKADGGFIRITFTMPLIGAFSDNEDAFTVSWHEYNFVPDGMLVAKVGEVIATYRGETDYDLILEMAWNGRFHNAVGQITVTYDGSGTLQGVGGSVEPFSVRFTPTDLVPKPNQSDQNHLEITATKMSVLTRIYYSGAQNGGEHMSVAGGSWTGVLTHIDDL